MIELQHHLVVLELPSPWQARSLLHAVDVPSARMMHAMEAVNSARLVVVDPHGKTLNQDALSALLSSDAEMEFPFENTDAPSSFCAIA